MVKLLAADAKDVPSGRAAFRLKSIFEAEMKNLEKRIKPIADNFQTQALKKVKHTLTPSLKVGAQKGSSAALSTVASWGGKNRRSKHDRRPDKNGKFRSFLALVFSGSSTPLWLC
jgi:hypothetical protein